MLYSVYIFFFLCVSLSYFTDPVVDTYADRIMFVIWDYIIRIPGEVYPK